MGMSKDTPSVLLVSSEIAPLAQTGGLAEVAGSLPLALREQGCEVAVAMPAYRQALTGRNWAVAADGVGVYPTGSALAGQILVGELAPGVPAYLVRHNDFFIRDGLYGGGYGPYPDNPERFIYFSRMIPGLCQAVGLEPDIIMANDWQTGLVMALLDLGALPRTAGVFTIHNQGFAGEVPPDRAGALGLPGRYFGLDGLEFYGNYSLLKAGIMYAQAVTTVSPSYAREIQTPEGGFGLDGLLRGVSHKLHGILNGVDYQQWNPAHDTHIAASYSPADLSGKRRCKEALLRRMDLPLDLMDQPLLGVVTRLSWQKGPGLIHDAAQGFFDLGAGLAVLGSGEPEYEAMFQGLRDRRPDRVGLYLGYDTALSHQVMAGADMVLMPSLYEPCGLAQMYGLKYGTVPVVRATGGLNDAVRDPGEGSGPGTGFKFGDFSAHALYEAGRRAIELYRNTEAWQTLMLSGMSQDFSWGRSAREYLKVFEQALAARRA